MAAIQATWPFQPHDVLFVDGPCIGQRRAIPLDRHTVTFEHFEESRWIHCTPREDDDIFRPRMRQTNYFIHMFYERLGVLGRCMRIASVEDRVDRIDKRDMRAVDIAMRGLPWSLGHEPSFLHDFDRWIVWSAYKNDAGSRSFRNWVESGGASWKLWTYYRGRYR